MNRLPVTSLLALAGVLFLSTGATANCTQGYWKNHPDQWCAGSLTLGNVAYTKDELLDIFHLEVAGNGLVSLAHQLIAAKLNVACGVNPTGCIGDADAMIGDLVVPPVGADHLDTAVTSPLVECLTAFNQSPTDPPDVILPCNPVSVDATTWGRVKTGYR